MWYLKDYADGKPVIYRTPDGAFTPAAVASASCTYGRSISKPSVSTRTQSRYMGAMFAGHHGAAKNFHP